MVTREQYLNRLIEWFPAEQLPEVQEVFFDMLEHGLDVEEAFEMVLFL